MQSITVDKLRIRRSIQRLQDEYNTGYREPLETVIRAIKGMQELPCHSPDSFFRIASFHGEPFAKPDWSGDFDTEDYWGGYCNHANVLFPTWHRAYILRFEEAMRRVPGCENVTLPFWDACDESGPPIPTVFTSSTFFLDGKEIQNPLYSYTLPDGLCNVPGNETRRTKPRGYTTVRYPQSGLVSNESDLAQTTAHNSVYSNQDQNTTILNSNLAAWLTGQVQISRAPGDPAARIPDTYSISARYKLCLSAPNYTVFSNTESERAWCSSYGLGTHHYAVSLESPHNAIHLALGGFYQKHKMNANPILGANGDMGEANSAAMDPIFFFHHAFVDYGFWKWQQKRRMTARGSLGVIKGYPGTNSSGQEAKFVRGLPPDTPLSMQTPLRPFRRLGQDGKVDSGDWYTSDDMTDIENDLGYTYGPGSLDSLVSYPELTAPSAEAIYPQKLISVEGISRTQYPGSFVVRVHAHLPDGTKIEVGREPVFSRWGLRACANCQTSL